MYKKSFLKIIIIGRLLIGEDVRRVEEIGEVKVAVQAQKEVLMAAQIEKEAIAPIIPSKCKCFTEVYALYCSLYVQGEKAKG